MSFVPPPAVPPVALVMARIAAGDRSAPFTLHEFYAVPIRRVVWRQLRKVGVHRVDPDELDGLVLDAALEVASVAGSWRPGGSLPWWYARGRIEAKVNEFVGIHADAADDHEGDLAVRHQPVAASEEPDVLQTFERLLRQDDAGRLALLQEVFSRARLDDDAVRCLLDYRQQQAQGDPSPARTLAEEYGCSDVALRQRVHRTRRRVKRVVESDPRYAPLADLVLVA